jgi:tRNA A-37 threonylcarbamoyl transferase component Bud32
MWCYAKPVGRQGKPVFPDFVLHQRGDTAIWIDRKFADQEFIRRLCEADDMLMEPRCELIKNEKKIKIGRLTVQIAGRPRSLYLKRYNGLSFARRLFSPLMQSGAVRSLRGAAILRAADIPTATPVAAIESFRRGALRKSFFISEEIADGKTADVYWREEMAHLKGVQGVVSRRRFLAELATLFQSLHARGIYHNDLKDANILVVGAHKETPMRLYLLDFEGVRRCSRVRSNRIIKNLVQINRTLGRYLRRSDKLFFLKRYLGASFTDEERKRRLIRKIMAESRRVDQRKARIA